MGFWPIGLYVLTVFKDPASIEDLCLFETQSLLEVLWNINWKCPWYDL